MRRFAAVACAGWVTLSAAAGAGRAYDFDTVERSAKARPPVDCGFTTEGLRWRGLAFDQGDRTALFAELARKGADGTWVPEARFGISTFNEANSDIAAGPVHCLVKGDTLTLFENALEADGYPRGTVVATVELAGVVEEDLVVSACGPSREQWRAIDKKKRGCGG
jgi:hypothetical protein